MSDRMGRIQRIHFVGIGGVGMSGIAEVLLNLGYQVQGSDLISNAMTERLVALGGRVFQGHDADNLCDVDVVVVSSAISATNAEVTEAQRRRIPVVQRAEMLAELMRFRYGIAVAGSHGKTTTTSLVACVASSVPTEPEKLAQSLVKAARRCRLHGFWQQIRRGTKRLIATRKNRIGHFSIELGRVGSSGSVGRAESASRRLRTEIGHRPGP